MQQMPREGRAFCMVDKNWKQVMAKAVVRKRVTSVFTFNRNSREFTASYSLWSDRLFQSFKITSFVRTGDV